MTSLFRDFFKYYTEHTRSSNTLISKSGSLQSPLVVGSLPTTRAQVSGVDVSYLDYICALACEESYKDPDKRKVDLDWQFKYDSIKSTTRTAVYIGRGITITLIIAIRGTKDLLDIGTDILVAAGATAISPRLNTQITFLNGLVKDYVDGGTDIDDIYICGHSLGALVALSAHFGWPKSNAVCFNIGVPPSARLPHQKGLEFDRKIHKLLESPNVILYLMEGDPIASVARGLIENEVIIKPNPPAKDQTEAHSMSFMVKQLKLSRPLTMNNPLTEYEKNLRYNFSR